MWRASRAWKSPVSCRLVRIFLAMNPLSRIRFKDSSFKIGNVPPRPNRQLPRSDGWLWSVEGSADRMQDVASQSRLNGGFGYNPSGHQLSVHDAGMLGPMRPSFESARDHLADFLGLVRAPRASVIGAATAPSVRRAPLIAISELPRSERTSVKLRDGDGDLISARPRQHFVRLAAKWLPRQVPPCRKPG
jgi:hypothetical protein